MPSIILSGFLELLIISLALRSFQKANQISNAEISRAKEASKINEATEGNDEIGSKSPKSPKTDTPKLDLTAIVTTKVNTKYE